MEQSAASRDCLFVGLLTYETVFSFNSECLVGELEIRHAGPRQRL